MEKNTFYTDLNIGQDFEFYTIELFKKKYSKDNVKFSYDKKKSGKDYDWKMKLNSQITLFENKHDIGSIDTNNIVVEKMCSNKPSGIYSSKSKYVIYLCYKGIYVLNIDKLKDYIKKNDKLHISRSGGDFGNAVNVLIPIDDFISLGKCLEQYANKKEYYDIHLKRYGDDYINQNKYLFRQIHNLK